jgi:hypothetical protein
MGAPHRHGNFKWTISHFITPRFRYFGVGKRRWGRNPTAGRGLPARPFGRRRFEPGVHRHYRRSPGSNRQSRARRPLLGRFRAPSHAALSFSTSVPRWGRPAVITRVSRQTRPYEPPQRRSFRLLTSRRCNERQENRAGGFTDNPIRDLNESALPATEPA